MTGDVINEQLAEHLEVGRSLTSLLPGVRDLARLAIERFEAGGTLYTFGNGGSAADAQHLCGELIGHYRADRRPLPAVTLTTDPTVQTCIANDYDHTVVFARQVQALVRRDDIVIAFSTSGRSPNIVNGLHCARERGAVTVLFGGGDGGPAAAYADLCLLVSSSSTPRIQEGHTFLLHALSELLDTWAASGP